MSEQQATHGLGCPRCGGMVPIPEGQTIVRCPFCDLRSLVQGERGIQRGQVHQRITREQATQSLQRFLRSKPAIARDAVHKASLEEVFLAHLPFWTNRARVLGWVFGQKEVGSGDNRRYEPREVRSTEDMVWTGAACDVGEFGVERVDLGGRAIEPFNPDTLHGSGLVFEPVNSASDAETAARQEFEQRVQKAANLDRIAQVFVRQTGWQESLIYYPLWVLRYSYRGRSFQVVVDAYSGEVLYGKAPGSVLYRAVMLVGGTAVGALVAVDGSALAFYTATQSSSDDSFGALAAGFFAIVIGFGIQYTAYRAFRFGEHYEFRQKSGPSTLISLPDSFKQIKALSSWLNR